MYRPRWICQMAAALGATRSIMDFDNSYEYIYVGAGYIRALYKRKAQLNGVPRVCYGCLPEPGHRSKQWGWWKSTTHTHRITSTNGGHKVREKEKKKALPQLASAAAVDLFGFWRAKGWESSSFVLRVMGWMGKHGVWEPTGLDG